LTSLLWISGATTKDKLALYQLPFFKCNGWKAAKIVENMAILQDNDFIMYSTSYKEVLKNLINANI